MGTPTTVEDRATLTEPWRHLAACNGMNTDYWFPDTTGATVNNSPAVARAIQICKTCPVQTQCLTWALERPEMHGIWGGTTAEQRRGIRRQPHTRIPCGTSRGYEQHRLWGQQPCPDCRRAHADYTNARRRIRQRAETRHTLEDGDTA